MAHNTRSQSIRSLTDADTSFSQAEAEAITKRLTDKEKQIREQSESLRMRQAELDKRENELLKNQPSTSETQSLLSAITALQKEFSFFRTIPDEIQNIKKQLNKSTDGNSAKTSTNQAQRSVDNPQSPHVNLTNANIQPSPIRLKDAVESIPKYNGHNMSVFQFCKMCERTLDLVPSSQEQYLVQLIINKLQGHAYQAVEGSEMFTVSDLTHRLKIIFGPNKSVDQYRGELGNAYMRPRESIYDYIGRIKDLRTAIVDGEISARSYYDDQLFDNIERSVIDSFVNGLPSDLLVRVKLEGYNSLDEAIIKAIQVSKVLEAESLRQRPNFPRGNATAPRADTTSLTTNNIAQPTNQRSSAPLIKPLIPGQPGPNAPESNTCRYCKKFGHLIDDCRKLAYKRSLQNASIPITSISNNNAGSGNAIRNPVTSDAPRVASQDVRQTPTTAERFQA